MKQVGIYSSTSGGNSPNIEYGNILAGIGGFDPTLHSGAATDAIPNVILRQCAISKVLVDIDAPGSGKSRVFTLLKNDLPTDLTFTVADLATQGADNVNVVDFDEDDTCSFSMLPVNTPAGLAGKQRYSYVIDTLGSRHSQYFSNSSNSIANFNLIPVYKGIFDSNTYSSGWNSNINQAYTIAPMNGSIEAYCLNIKVRNSLHSGNKICIWKNGVRQDGSPGTINTETIATLSGYEYRAVKNNSFSLPFEIGDELAIEHQHLYGSGEGAVAMALTVLVLSQNAGESIMSIASTAQTTSASGYPAFRSPTSALTTGSNAWESNENNAVVIAPDQSFTIGNLTMRNPTSFGVGADSRTITGRKNGGNELLTVTLIGDETTYVRDDENFIDVVSGDEICFMQTYIGSLPSSLYLRMSMTQYIAPDPTGDGTGLGIVTPGARRDIYNAGIELKIPTPYFVTYLKGE